VQNFYFEFHSLTSGLVLGDGGVLHSCEVMKACDNVIYNCRDIYMVEFCVAVWNWANGL
jgi:hypothetical protein